MNVYLRRLIGLGASLAGLVLVASLTQPIWAQTTGTLAPVEKRQWFDDSGLPLAGGFVATYTAGTSTSAVVYTDAALTTPHANPVVLDSAGRATIYLAQAAYKFVISNSAAVPLYTTDNVQSTAYSAAQATITSTCDVRLTLTSSTPVTTSDVTGATTVYATPYKGNKCALYDGANWNVRTFAELSLTLGADAANSNYDVWLYDNAGVVTIERLVWTNATTRATAVVLQDGILSKSGALTRRYIGTYRTTNIAGTTEDSRFRRYVWNYLHKATRPMRGVDTVGSWTYSTLTYRQANASTLLQLNLVTGVLESSLAVHVRTMATNSGTGVLAYLAVGEDTTVTPLASGCQVATQALVTSNSDFSLSTTCQIAPPLGYHYYAWLEQATASGTTTWTGNGGGANDIGAIYGLFSE